MTDFQIKYAIRSLMSGSYQDDADVLLYRASVLENNRKERQNTNMDMYIK